MKKTEQKAKLSAMPRKIEWEKRIRTARESLEASRIKRFYNTGDFMGYMKREAAGRRNNGR